jgi:hypothetical protein
MVNQALLNELNKIILEDYGKKLNAHETSELGYALLGYYEGLIDIEKTNQK